MEFKSNYDVVILDSGVDTAHPDLRAFSDIDCVALDAQTSVPVRDAGDVFGHATAIAGIIKREKPKASILSLRIFEKKDGFPKSSEEKLLQALSFIDRNLSVKVINMSFDVAEPMCMRELTQITRRLADRGVIMVAALKNSGGITFPAALEWVIGVSIDDICPISQPLNSRDDTVINMVAPPRLLRVAWQNGSHKYVRGSSFVCANVTAQALSFIEEGRSGYREVLAAFREKFPPITQELSAATGQTANEKPAFTIKKAAAFPFNKEMHSVVRYADELTFELVDVYDVRQTFQLGMDTNEVLKQACPQNFTIKNIDDVDWDSFDTLILGCVSQLIGLFRRTDWIKKIIADALAHSKNIFSFENISYLTEEKTNRIYYPSITKENVPKYRDSRLFRTAVPIVGVFGTQSQQGKFTLQMLLRREFKKLDCVIGQIGTEPHSLLFGCDYVFANGFNAVIEIDNRDQTLYLNDLLRRTCEKLPDIILTGTQKGLVPAVFNNMRFYSRQNYAFLDGIKPDYAILTVSVTDSVDYIKRSVGFLADLSCTKTLALVLFPVSSVDEKMEEFKQRRILSQAEYETFRDKVNAELDLPVLFLNDEHLGEKLMQILLEKLTKTPETADR